VEAITSSKKLLEFTNYYLSKIEKEYNELKEQHNTFLSRELDGRVFRSYDRFEGLKSRGSYYNRPWIPNPEYKKFKNKFKRFLHNCTPMYMNDMPARNIEDEVAIIKRNKEDFRREWNTTKQYIQGTLDIESLPTGEYFYNNQYQNIIRRLVRYDDVIKNIKDFKDSASLLETLDCVELNLSDDEITSLGNIERFTNE